MVALVRWLGLAVISAGIATDAAPGALVGLTALTSSDPLARTPVSGNGDLQADRLEKQGRFKEAAAILTNALTHTRLSAKDRRSLEFEMDRLERIRKDFPLTKDALFKALQASVRDVTAEEFDRWIDEGRFDRREIDGETRFMRSSVSNLYYRYPEMESRRVKPRNPAPHESAVLDACRVIAAAARADGKPYVLPKRFHVTMTVTAKADAAPAGEIVRAWLPVPRRYPFQTDFEFHSALPPAKRINTPTSPIRAAYLEQRARAGEPTRFQIEYAYTAHGVRFDVEPARVRSGVPRGRSLAPFLRETTHVEFTPAIRALSTQIVGEETNPFRKAKRCYDWIAENIKYSFAVEYSTIRNLSEYCLSRGYGDCGQEGLLFITLCRLNGIPARWQSGWNLFPKGKNIHDWCEIYLAPCGWMPVDPYMGIWAMQYARTLTPEEQREVRDFYFGGLDQWRMAANSDHCRALSPPKRSIRSDNVDFQRGELEWNGRNIYFDQFSYNLVVKEQPLAR